MKFKGEQKSTMNIFVGRQPILDLNEDIYGYELLHRDSTENAFPNIDPDQATIELLINTFISIGSKEIVGQHLSFINFTGSLLAQDVFDGLDPQTVVIEVLEDVAVTPSLLTKLRELKAEGFRIALDDFELQEQHHVHKELFNIVDIIKIDFRATTAEARAKMERFIRCYPQIQLLAEKVETKADLIEARLAGYTLFQGFFFAEPEIIEGFEIPPKPLLHFQIIEQLHDPDANIERIATLIKSDISLTYRLLRVVNSAGIGVVQEIRSIKQALVILGLNEMRKWVQVLALREFGQSDSGGRIQALIDFSLARAKLCEQLAVETGKSNRDEYFLTGLFSMMDLIMKQEWPAIFTQISLSQKVQDTLLGKETEISPYVRLIEAIERLDSDQIDAFAKEMNIDQVRLTKYSQQANRWARMLD